MENITRELITLGVSKWAIVKFVYYDNKPVKAPDVKKHWNNVDAWEREWWQPNVEHQRRLNMMLMQERQRRNVKTEVQEMAG